MNDPLPKLPLDMSDFGRLRTEGYVYVDKTRQIHDMVNRAVYFFLSRPRRFGKSLTVSTLDHLFRGDRELFDGLWIGEEGRWDFQPHPVVVLDFNAIPSLKPGQLETSLNERLIAIAADHGITLSESSPPAKFRRLLTELAAKYQQRVVVLIDEYDKPLIDHIGRGEERIQCAFSNRDTLKSLFGVLKANDVVPLLRLVFITGVSRFSKVSIFSELNNLNDQSMDDRASDLVGWTDDELRSNFVGHIERLAQHLDIDTDATFQRLKQLYNGYRFSRSQTQVFNPYCLVRALDCLELDDYWFSSGSPSFLIRMLKEQALPPIELEGMEMDRAEFDTFELESLSLKGLLLQSGYITIQDCDDDVFTLGFPNQEVRTGFYKKLLFNKDAAWIPPDRTTDATRLRRHLNKEDLDTFIETARGLFASIPYQQGDKLQESHFHALFYMMLALSGMRVHCELLTSKGRIDVAVEFPDKVYVIELKCNQSADDAIEQIEDRGYMDRYVGRDKKRIAIGINFSTNERNITDWSHSIHK